ncbi:MAG: diphthine--ammonia ligase [Microbacter sp.]
MNKKKVLFSWSGGKDSAYCLHQVLSNDLYDVRYLLTTLNGNHHRISMHGVREALLDEQAEQIGIPLLKAYVYEGTNAEYEQQMETMLTRAKSEGIESVVFGDLFLADLRAFRERQLARIGMSAVFPLWGMNTAHLVREFVRQQFKSIVSSTNDAYLGEEWVGRQIDQAFIDQLPANVDPCGENGEFHSFCFDGPIFRREILFSKGEKVYKTYQLTQENDDTHDVTETTKGFWYCDLIPLS